MHVWPTHAWPTHAWPTHAWPTHAWATHARKAGTEVGAVLRVRTYYPWGHQPNKIKRHPPIIHDGMAWPLHFQLGSSVRLRTYVVVCHHAYQQKIISKHTGLGWFCRDIWSGPAVIGARKTRTQISIISRCRSLSKRKMFGQKKIALRSFQPTCMV